MNNNNLRASDYRSRARESLKDKYWGAFGVTLLATLLIGGFGGFNFSFTTGEDSELSNTLASIPDSAIYLISGIFATAIVVALAIAAVHFVLYGVTQMGLARYNIKLCMGESASIKDLFAYYKTRLGTGMLATVLFYLFTLLWYLLFLFAACLVIGGFMVILGLMGVDFSGSLGMALIFVIVFAVLLLGVLPLVLMIIYRYALTYYLLADDDTLGAVAAIRKSKELMKGNKWKMFCLDMSFIGWQLLGAMACGVGAYFVAPYVGNANAHFYCELVGKNNVVELDTNAQEIDYTLEENAQEIDYTLDVGADTDSI